MPKNIRYRCHEYLSDAYIALDAAKRGFKPELGIKFTTYASAVIRKELVRIARDSLIRVGLQARYQASRVLGGKMEAKEPRIKDALRVMQGIVPLVDVASKDDSICQKEIIEEINVRLKELDERTQLVLYLRYKEDLTLEEIGQRLNPPITHERVRQIEFKGLRKLRRIVNY